MNRFRRHMVDQIIGFSEPVRFGRLSPDLPKLWERRSIKWRDRVLTGLPDDRKTGLGFNDWGHHCRLCAAVNAPFHERIHRRK